MSKFILLIMTLLFAAPVMANTVNKAPQTEQEEVKKKKKGKGLKGKLKGTVNAVNKNLLQNEGETGTGQTRLTVNEEGVEEEKAKEKKK